ncbi:superoxide dismutase [Candidatus Kinetoplastidibacterium crithidiae]|uniref:Superoxide dismutase n=1 Tax=Candidatus Kinetoplastidibacterium crithidiae TCC036E TaxID=1208918 RepID=M1L4D0_9PROT|nr:Fe-Mn family superoxide dismutase [Candidatus Kinetoplastibacterium crithidii]EPY39824.1 superoxide dismutase, Fe-Mn family [Angomonas deanei]AFZ82770.1 superoxide dismutase [Candidatus Kinetoplastibacterium crithidii (ex Angomonas deanei ATCC 30255)]AGF47578.1 Fe-Mn family superoxide dismutase [Candidatus Kinetoplastibacterium crithidii TCC036E]EPY40729.1 superoxide dismutase (Fe) [Angomonas deanei]EPY41971.1 superoxide dismutase, Fe-Mn family [Angomonas deanei]|eukprot:EPY39824.1 superoxide dismutase, Fe-Mn family [Angomonas deanei]
MIHVLPDLPYKIDSLSPYISKETLEFHYGKHHQTYINNLNSLIQNTEFQEMSLEEIIKKSSGAIFNNAAQVWNHNFYWNSICPDSTKKPEGNLADAINQKWGNFESFKLEFNKQAASNFGSGWTWLVKKSDRSLEILNTSNAGTIVNSNDKAMITCDVWEHAYYIDYRNARVKYLENFWSIINWKFAEQNFSL